jgi:4-oxalocrotonate tautomerase
VAVIESKEAKVPFINVKVMGGVLSQEQRTEIAERMTESFVAVAGEPARPVTWVVVEEVGGGGDWTMGGNVVTTAAVKELLAGAPA